MDEWIDEGELYCRMCGISFKVCVKNEEIVTNFCPSCASRELELVEE